MDLFHINYGFPPISDPIPPYWPSVTVDNLTYMQLYTPDHVRLVNTSSGLLIPLWLPSDGPSEEPRFRQVHVDSYDAATGVSDAEAPPSHPSHKDDLSHLERLGLAPIPSQFGTSLDGGDPLATEGTSTCTPDLLPSPSVLQVQRNEVYHSYFPQTPPNPNPEINVISNTLFEFAPYDTPSIPTGGISRIIFPTESGDFPVSTGSMRDSRTATTSLGTRSIYSTTSGQITPSAIHPPRGLSNHSGYIEPFSTYGSQTAPPTHQSALKGHQHAAALSPITSSQVPAPRQTPKRHWCKKPGCGAGFTQRQGLTRHRRGVHGPRRLCPHCRDFEWSPARKYALRDHYREEHPGVALPEGLY
ncbi:hypothetical protein EI94DRAFT_1336984 [Lactarius quietus]|nr:hypothetical protein EI94DRAFT_1336984 [Lactarius quietus]